MSATSEITWADDAYHVVAMVSSVTSSNEISSSNVTVSVPWGAPSTQWAAVTKTPVPGSPSRGPAYQPLQRPLCSALPSSPWSASRPTFGCPDPSGTPLVIACAPAEPPGPGGDRRPGPQQRSCLPVSFACRSPLLVVVSGGRL